MCYGMTEIRLILMTVLPLLQFCSKAFGDYAANSEVVDILNCHPFLSFLDSRHFWCTD